MRPAEAEPAEPATAHEGEPERLSSFASLRIRNYRLYSAGQAVSVAGNWMQNIAVGWLTLQLTHSSTMLGLVTGARYLPILLLGAWGGLVADRHDRRTLLLVTQTLFAIQAVLLTALSWAHLMSLPLLFVMVLAIGLTNVFDNPARQSFISELVGRQYLGNAIAVNSTLVNTAKLVGPGVAGIIIVVLGVTPCFAIDALSFLAVIASLLLLRTAEMYPSRRERRAKGQIRAALLAIGRTPDLLFPMLMVYVTGIMTWEFPVSLPVLTTSGFHAGATGYGTAMAAMSAGAVIGGLFAVRRRRHSSRSLAISALIWGFLICVASLAPNLLVALVLLIFVGSGSITFNSSAKTLMQLTADPQISGRVMSIWSIGWLGGTVIGAPAVGLIGAHWGARGPLLAGGLAAAGIGAAVLILTLAAPRRGPRDRGHSGPHVPR